MIFIPGLLHLHFTTLCVYIQRWQNQRVTRINESVSLQKMDRSLWIYWAKHSKSRFVLLTTELIEVSKSSSYEQSDSCTPWKNHLKQRIPFIGACRIKIINNNIIVITSSHWSSWRWPGLCLNYQPYPHMLVCENPRVSLTLRAWVPLPELRWSDKIWAKSRKEGADTPRKAHGGEGRAWLVNRKSDFADHYWISLKDSARAWRR